jgi:hypothetical protein
MDIRPERKSDSLPLNQPFDFTRKATGKRFEITRQANASEEKELSRTAGFQSVAADFRKADLKNPVRVEEMVNSAVDHLITNEFPELSSSDDQAIAAWMRSDPIARQRILEYFERTLS